jgi:hypothetical protein
MNGTDIKKAAINKAKQVAQAANGNGGKKRRKGQDLKPIITTEQQKSQEASPASPGSFQYKYVHVHSLPPVPTQPSSLHFAAGAMTTPCPRRKFELTPAPAVYRIRPHPSVTTRHPTQAK